MVNKSRPRKLLHSLRKMIDKNRSFVKFKCYDEDKLFSAEMRQLETMYRQSREQQMRQQGFINHKDQDEDVNTDEDLLVNNKKVVSTELKMGIDQFTAINRKQSLTKLKILKAKQELVRNFENKLVLSGTVGDAWK